MPKGSVTINYERCKLCGICVAVCPTKNLEIVEGRLTPYDRCTGCKLCELHCPDFAIAAERMLEPEPKPEAKPKAKPKKKAAPKPTPKDTAESSSEDGDD